MSVGIAAAAVATMVVAAAAVLVVFVILQEKIAKIVEDSLKPPDVVAVGARTALKIVLLFASERLPNLFVMMPSWAISAKGDLKRLSQSLYEAVVAAMRRQEKVVQAALADLIVLRGGTVEEAAADIVVAAAVVAAMRRQEEVVQAALADLIVLQGAVEEAAAAIAVVAAVAAAVVTALRRQEEVV